MPELSIIIPVLNEEHNIKPFYTQLKKVLNKIKKSHELIFVDDGSTDSTFTNIKELNKKDKAVKIIQFQNNFGKAAALSAGFPPIEVSRPTPRRSIAL